MLAERMARLRSLICTIISPDSAARWRQSRREIGGFWLISRSTGKFFEMNQWWLGEKVARASTLRDMHGRFLPISRS